MEQKPIYSSASVPTTWDGEDVWLLGSGPSAMDFDVSRLKGRRVVCINDAVSRLLFWGVGQEPSLVSVFSLDPRWILRNHLFLSSLKAEKYLALPLETFPFCGGILGAYYLQWGHERGLSEDPSVINTGGHSGYGALGLAYHKRARRVYLLGYDLNPGSDNLWASQYGFWAQNYTDTLPQLEARGIEVFNCNSRSAIGAFPYADPNPVLGLSEASGGS